MGNKISRLFNIFFSPLNSHPKGNYFCLPKPPSIDDKSQHPGEILAVKNVDYCIAANGAAHHTSKYELMTRTKDPCLVVRRGQKFTIDITFSRPYDPVKDGISFIFTVAGDEKPSYGQGALVALPLLKNESEVTSRWSAIIQSQTGNHVVVELSTSSYSVVAQWKMEIDTKCEGHGAISYSHPLGIYLLFNPWCPEDNVYVAEQDRREEYVLMDTGLIWKGSHHRRRRIFWKYAQYEKDILDCSLLLIQEIGKVKGNARGDPIKVSRAISAAVNADDDFGALEGNWGKDFRNGSTPDRWMGSMEILQTFFKERQSVKYGQCWVFSGVFATVCRAVGLPCRPVTTFESAHDTRGSLTIDYFIDKNGATIKMPEGKNDSVWNFHVWNEIWMKRPDLAEDGSYDGWQAVDSTPQEHSDYVYQCGPASVAAVKLGDVQKPYDNGFIFAEVNADEVYWKYNGPNQPLKLLRKKTTSVGKAISTKAVGEWEREDITDSYKYPEKSDEERVAMLKALKMSESSYSRYYLNEIFNDVKFELALRDDITIGEPFGVVLIVKNDSSDKAYTTKGTLRMETALYNGKVIEIVKLFEFNNVIKASSTEEIEMNVSFDEYYEKLVSQCAFKISCLASVTDTDYEYFGQTNFRVRKPDIKISLKGLPNIGQEIEAEIKLLNPLPIPLKKCMFSFEVDGLQGQSKIKLSEKVAPGDFATAVVKFIPPWHGSQTLAAKFSSRELDDVDGFLEFVVQ